MVKRKKIISKKSPCNFYKKGICNKGKDCNFDHNIKQGTDSICKFSINGSCNKKECYFSHDLSKYPCKYLYILGKCDNGFSCKFSHEYIKNRIILDDFIKDNEKNILNHINSKIMTPLNTYCLKNNYLDINKQFDLMEDSKSVNNNKNVKFKEENIYKNNSNLIDFNPFA